MAPFPHDLHSQNLQVLPLVPRHPTVIRNRPNGADYPAHGPLPSRPLSRLRFGRAVTPTRPVVRIRIPGAVMMEPWFPYPGHVPGFGYPGRACVRKDTSLV